MPRFELLHTDGDTAGTGPQPAVGDTASPLPRRSVGDRAGTGPLRIAGDLTGTGPQRLARDPSGTGPQRLAGDPARTGPQPTGGGVFSWPAAPAAPAARPEPAPATTGPQPVLGDNGSDTAESPAARLLSGRRAAPRSPSGVVVPPAGDSEEQNRLPIFEAVESDWFRRVRRAAPRPDQAAEANGGWTSAADAGWTSAADAGWQAAEVVQSPSSAGVTPAGLPKRMPRANLVPGTAQAPAAGQSAPPAAPVRSAAATRDRFASYQRGARRGRAEASGAESDGENDETS
jgi:hypothetical protein